MNKVNYRREGERQTAALGEKKRLLLHCCCAPCSSASIEYLKEYFHVTAFFYNPNIEDAEYERRKAELVKFLNATGWADIYDCEHDKQRFYAAVRGLEGCPEGGERCEKCYALRLDRTAEAAKAGGYDFFASTLTISPMKSADKLNAAGEAAGKKHGVTWLYSDFKKGGGYLRSIELSREYGLYRQNYCGCVFSMRGEKNSAQTIEKRADM